MLYFASFTAFSGSKKLCNISSPVYPVEIVRGFFKIPLYILRNDKITKDRI